MRREMELIRQLLLPIEDQGNDLNAWIEDAILDGWSKDQISHHTWLLKDGGYIEAIDLSSLDGSEWAPRCLTLRGHEFLDAVREKDVWVKTLELAKKGGVGTFEAIKEIAVTLAKKKIEKFPDIA